MSLSPAWIQGVLLTFLIGFAILGYLALRVYEEHAPVPASVVDEAGMNAASQHGFARGGPQRRSKLAKRTGAHLLSESASAQHARSNASRTHREIQE
jgi:hypothetical protein